MFAEHISSEWEELFIHAKNASVQAYAPYSQFKVGAAILTSAGKIYTGCNVENSSYGGTICAERTAIVKAVSEGERIFIALAVYVASSTIFSPCGICRQVLAEFSDDLVVIYGNDQQQQQITIRELLPEKFFFPPKKTCQ